MKVYCVFRIDLGEPDELCHIFETREKAEQWIDDLPWEEKNDSWSYKVKEWEVE
jgi:hypothetical protein